MVKIENLYLEKKKVSKNCVGFRSPILDDWHTQKERDRVKEIEPGL